MPGPPRMPSFPAAESGEKPKETARRDKPIRQKQYNFNVWPDSMRRLGVDTDLAVPRSCPTTVLSD